MGTESRAWIGPREIALLLDVADRVGIHREAVRVPLDTEPDGRVAIENGRLLIVAPAAGDLAAFAAGLDAQIRALPGFERLKRSMP